MWMSELDGKLAKTTIDTGPNGFNFGSAATLNGLAEQIKLGEGQSYEVKSIPDVFEKAYHFMIGLYYNDNKGFYADKSVEAKKEWRALLAVCVTSNLLLKNGWKLEIRAVSAPPELTYAQAALHMKPQKTIWEPQSEKGFNEATDDGVKAEIDWLWDGMKEIVLYKGHDKYTIAFTSPATLLFPAPDWEQTICAHCKNDFPWVKDDTYYDPLDKAHAAMLPHIATFLADWLHDFRNFLRGTNDAANPNNKEKPKKFKQKNSAWYKDLCEKKKEEKSSEDISLLSEFHDQLVKAYVIPAPLPDKPRTKTWDFLDPEHSAFRGDSSIASLIPPAPRLEDGTHSEVLVLGFVNEQGMPSIYLDPDAGTKIAAGTFTVADAIGDMGVREEIERCFFILDEEKAFQKEIYYLTYNIPNNAYRPEQFKSEIENTLSCLDDSYCIVWDKLSCECRLFFMPLGKDGLRLINQGYQYGIEVLTDTRDMFLGVTVSIEITLQGNVKKKLSKRYMVHDNGPFDPNSEVKVIEWSGTRQVPIAAVWPSANIGTTWKEYWFFCYDTPDAKEDSGYDPDSSNGTYSLRPLMNEGLVEQKSITQKAKSGGNADTNHKYFQLEEFPRYVALLHEDKHSANGASVIGYLKVKEKKLPDKQNTTHKYIGSVDFGTASTVMMGGAGDKRRLSDAGVGAGNIIGLPIYYNEVGFPALAYVTKYFKQDLALPMATLLYDYNKDEKNDDRVLYEMSRIYNKEIHIRNQKLLREDEVEANLKWSQDVNKKLVDVFFLDLFGYMLLDAVSYGISSLGDFTLRVSYPSAMKPDDRDTFVESVRKQLKAAAKKFTKLLDQNDSEPTIDVYTESEAAARYFIGRKQDDLKIEDRLCVIDIGGGTTDLFYVEKYNGVGGRPTSRAIESSLKTGAREILVDMLAHTKEKHTGAAAEEAKDSYLYKMLENAGLLSLTDNTIPLGKEDIKALIDTTTGFHACWEGYLNRKIRVGYDSVTTLGDKLVKYWKNGQSKTEADKRLQTAIALSIGGIVYYAGMLLRDGKSTSKSVHLAFAGNGSKMLEWLGNENIFKYFFGKIFQDSLNYGAVHVERVDVHLPKDNERKFEAADGMFYLESQNFDMISLKTSNHHISSPDGKKLMVLPIILAGESFYGKKTMSVEECEAKLQEAVAQAAKQSDTTNYVSKFDKLMSDKRKEFAKLASSDNKAGSNLSDDDYLANLDLHRIGCEEFDRFINCFNVATEEYSGIGLLRLPWYRDVDLDALHCEGRVLPSISADAIDDDTNVSLRDRAREISGVNLSVWLKRRDAVIDQYINQLRSGKSFVEKQSFFLQGMKALHQLVMETL